MPPSQLPASSSRGGSLESDNELREFLKIARPEWSCPRSRGGSDISRVMAKLRAINVTDVETLFKRIDENTINNDLHAANKRPPLSREAIDSIKRRRPFMQILETTDVPLVRKIGSLAPVPQMLSKKPVEPIPAMRGNRAALGSTRSASLGMATVQSEGSFGAAAGGRARLRGARPRKRRQPDYGESSSLGGDLQHDSSRHDSLRSSRGVSHDSPSGGVNSSVGGEDISSPASLPRSLRSSKGITWVEDAPDTPERPGLRRAASIGSLPEPTSLEEQVERMHHASLTMFGGKSGGNRACWSCRHHKTPLQQGEEMLREQAALDEQRHLIRTVKLNDFDLPIRSHIAENIRLKLREEKKRDERGLAVQQRCQNIRKQINLMVNSRRELAGLRSRVQSFAEGDDATTVGGTDPLNEFPFGFRMQKS